MPRYFAKVQGPDRDNQFQFVLDDNDDAAIKNKALNMEAARLGIDATRLKILSITEETTFRRIV